MILGVTVDTSVLVSAMSVWHPSHLEARAVLGQRATALVGHTVLEAYSVLTRLPSPHRVEPELASAALGALTLPLVAIEAQGIMSVIQELGPERIGGGAAYDALIAATARHHGLVLVTADHRARSTYEAMGVQIQLLASE